MKKYKIEIKWALIHAAMFLVWMILEKLLGFHSVKLDQQQFVAPLILIPSIIIYILALLDKRKNYRDGNTTYRNNFKSGLLLTIFMVLLTPINQFTTFHIISPDYFANAIKYSVNTGVLTEVQAEQQFNIKNYLIISVVAGLVTGIIFSAIISLFVKSKK